MAVEFGSIGTSLFVTIAATSHDVAYPAGIALGDVLILFVVTNGSNMTAPASPWVTVFNDTVGPNPKGGMFLKVATGAEAGTLNFTTTSTTLSACMLRYTGVDPATPQDVPATSVSTTNLTNIVIPSLTTVTDMSMLVFCGGFNLSTGTTTPPTGATERRDFEEENASSPKSGSINDELFPNAGATGDMTITLSSLRANWGAMVALRAAGAEPGSVLAPSQGTGTGHW